MIEYLENHGSQVEELNLKFRVSSKQIRRPVQSPAKPRLTFDTILVAVSVN